MDKKLQPKDNTTIEKYKNTIIGSDVDVEGDLHIGDKIYKYGITNKIPDIPQPNVPACLYNTEKKRWSKLTFNALYYYGLNRLPFRSIWIGNNLFANSINRFEEELSNWLSKSGVQDYAKRKWSKYDINDEKLPPIIEQAKQEGNNNFGLILILNKEREESEADILTLLKALSVPVILFLNIKGTKRSLAKALKLQEQLKWVSPLEVSIGIDTKKFDVEEMEKSKTAKKKESFCNFLQYLCGNKLIHQKVTETDSVLFKAFKKDKLSKKGYNFYKIVAFSENYFGQDNEVQQKEFEEELLDLTYQLGDFNDYKNLLLAFCQSKNIKTAQRALNHAYEHPAALKVLLAEGVCSKYQYYSERKYSTNYDLIATLLNYFSHNEETVSFINSKLPAFPKEFEIVIKRMLDTSDDYIPKISQKLVVFLLLTGEKGKLILNEVFDKQTTDSQFLTVLASDLNASLFDKVFSNLQLKEAVGMYSDSWIEKMNTKPKENLIKNKKLLFHEF